MLHHGVLHDVPLTMSCCAPVLQCTAWRDVTLPRHLDATLHGYHIVTLHVHHGVECIYFQMLDTRQYCMFCCAAYHVILHRRLTCFTIFDLPSCSWHGRWFTTRMRKPGNREGLIAGSCVETAVERYTKNQQRISSHFRSRENPVLKHSSVE